MQIHGSPISYRYIDSSITVPLQMRVFYLIFSAALRNICSGISWQRLAGTVFMIARHNHAILSWVLLLV